MSLSTARPRAPDLCGCALDGRYELHALIGEGAFGRVYRGRDRRLERSVAVKVIKPWWAEDPDWARTFEREAQLMARISDPGIVQVFDVGYAEEGLYYVCELVEGESLETRLRRGPLSPWEAANVAEQLCRALDRAHAEYVVHLDVKPANVLISNQGQVKVGDFGVARLAEGTTDRLAGTVVGTPSYMAPEQARGRATSPATDVYSVGVVLYEMLAGRPPFAGDSVIELALCHLQDPPPPLPPTTPRALVAIVDRALAKEPAARYRHAGEMRDALAGARTPTSPLPPTPTGRISSSTSGPPTATPSAPPTSSTVAAPSATASTSSTPSRPRPPSAGSTAATQALRDNGGAATRVAPKMFQRHDVNPAGRRRTIALFSLVLLLLLAMAVSALVIGTVRQVSVPNLQGLTRVAAGRTLRREKLRPEFAVRYSYARRGTAVRQSPSPGSRVDEGSRVSVVLSGGPPPVAVPRLIGTSDGGAKATLQRLGLQARVQVTPAPGVTPGLVTNQAPGAGVHVLPGSTVSLSVAEIPSWRPLTAFSDRSGGSSVPFRIRGTRWRIVYRMSFDGICGFIFICDGPNAQITNLGSSTSVVKFGLGDGSDQIRTVDSGPGVYQIRVTPGSDTANWSIQVQDYY